MTSAILLTSSLLAVLLLAALVREVRLRRAMQALLSKLLAKLRGPRASTYAPPSSDDDPASSGRRRWL